MIIIKFFDVPQLALGFMRARADSGLTIKQLAAKAGISMSMVGACERGERTPSLETLYRLGAALNVSVFELLP